MTTNLAAQPAPLLSEEKDEQIVARVLAGEAHLYEILMRRHNPRVYRVTRGILRSDADAEDAMQEAYVQAFTKLAQFEGRSSFATWLTRIAVHAALARLRRAKGETVVDDFDALDVAPEKYPMSSQAMAKSPEHDAGDREMRHMLEASIDALPDHYRMVFVLRAVEEMTVGETAESLGIPDETVRTRFFRARSLLKDHLFDRLDSVSRTAYEFHLSRCDRVVAAVLAKIGARRPGSP